jgi:putative PEP-CTERM system TPR-repeat lipoprotein
MAASVLGCGGDSPEKMVASAKEYLAKGDRPAAIIQLRNALQEAPDNGEARFLLGKARLDARDLVSAEKELRRALELNWPADEVLPLLARAMVELDHEEALIKEFGDRKLGDARAQATFQSQLGDAYLQRNEPAAASKAYAAALEARSDYAPAQLGRAVLLAREGKLDQALAQVDSILATSPKLARAHVVRGSLLSAKGDAPGARQALEAAIAADAEALAPRLMLMGLLIQYGDFEAAAKLLESTRKVAPRDVRLGYLGALLAFREGELDKAREQLQEVLKRAPQNVPSLTLAGTIDLREKRYAVAAANFSKVLARAPDHVFARQQLVQTYLRMGQAAKAQETLRPLLAKGTPQAPRLLLLAGETFLANGDAKTASDYFQAASKAEKTPAAVARIRLGQIALATGRTEEGFQQLEAASDLDESRYQADLAIIAAHLRRNELDKAMSAARTLEKKQPNNPLSFQIIGEIHLKKRDAAAARRSFERALELQPDYLPAARQLGRLDLAAKRPDEARKRFEAMIAKDNRNDQLYLVLAEFEASAGADATRIAGILQRAIDANPQSAPARYALIRLHERNGDLKAALAAAQAAQAALPGDARILDAVGRVQQLAGEIDQAIETTNRWAALQPESTTPLMRLASLHVGQKSYERAIDDLKRARKLAPDAREPVLQLARVYLAANRPEDALAEARQLQKSEPKNAAGYALEGEILFRQKKFAQAEKAYREALRASPRADTLAIALHAVLLESGKASEADKFIRNWLAENPKNATARVYLGVRDASDGNLKAAAGHYRAAIENDADNVTALNNLAWIGGEIGDPKAIVYAERAAKLAPENPAVLDTYGTLLIKKGDVAKGLEFLERASARDTGKHGIRRLKYAQELVKAGQKDQARKELEALQALPEDFPGKSEIPALLKAL